MVKWPRIVGVVLHGTVIGGFGGYTIDIHMHLCTDSRALESTDILGLRDIRMKPSHQQPNISELQAKCLLTYLGRLRIST